MKKILFLLLIINFSLPCYANWDNVKNNIRDFLEIPPSLKSISQAELKAKEEVFLNLDKYFADYLAGKILNKENNTVNSQNITLEVILSNDDKKIENLYRKYKDNRNNMNLNKELYDLSSSYAKQYTEVYDETVGTRVFVGAAKQYKNLLDNSFKNSYITSTDVYKSNTDVKQIAKDFETEFNEVHHEAYYKVQNLLTTYIDKYKKISKEVLEYSTSYETKKVQNFYKKNYGAINFGGTMDILLSPYDTPKENCYYVGNSYAQLRVIQKLNNGVIVTHAYQNAYGYQSHFKNAFIETNKPYVQNQMISGKFLYDGIYTYTNVLGANNTVWKFKELRYPTEKLYFYHE